MKLSALRTAFVSMTTPGGAHDATATWAKVVRAAQKVGPWCEEELDEGIGPTGSQRDALSSTHHSF